MAHLTVFQAAGLKREPSAVPLQQEVLSWWLARGWKREEQGLLSKEEQAHKKNWKKKESRKKIEARHAY